jgi:hypothetical protein
MSPHSEPSEPSEEWKGEPQMVELSHNVTVEPLPDNIKAEGGFVVDTEHLASVEGLKLTKDGHVSDNTY